jgi:16S rRNA (adenine1518-N6/adenine1519-N6)-dimethyltransferase
MQNDSSLATDPSAKQITAAINDLPPLREIIEAHQLSARKGLGQNFLLDLNLTRKIARAAGPLSELTVLEIGPGPGGLTRALLLEGAKKVVAVERDPRCVGALTSLVEAAAGRLQLIEADALEFQETDVIQGPCAIVANLPYNIATPLLAKWLQRPTRFHSLTLMFQREVADRIVAAPGSKSYGRLSILAQWPCQAKKLFDVPRTAFTPAPKVTSSIVQLRPRETVLAAADRLRLQAIVAAAFGQRRKMIRTSLKQIQADTETWIMAAGLNPRERAENLSIEDFCRLENTLPPKSILRPIGRR